MKGRYSSRHTDLMLSHDDEVPVWGDYRSFGDPNKKKRVKQWQAFLVIEHFL